MKTLVILCLFFTLACQPQQSTSLSESEISAVMEATTQYGNAIVAEDFNKIKSLMETDMVLMPSQDQAAIGIEASMATMQAFPEIEGRIRPEKIEGSGNLAYVRGNFDLTFIINDSTQVPDTGKYIEVWKKQDDGSWKIKVDIWNSDNPPEM
jgi:ketosteroid isomerase-like protein